MSIFYFCPDLTPCTATKLKENKSKVTQAIVIVWVSDSIKCTVLLDVIHSVSRGFFFAWGPRNNVSDIKCPLYSCPKYCRLSPFPAQVKNIFFPKYFYTRPEIIDCMMSCSRDTIPSSFPWSTTPTCREFFWRLVLLTPGSPRWEHKHHH